MTAVLGELGVPADKIELADASGLSGATGSPRRC